MTNPESSDSTAQKVQSLLLSVRASRESTCALIFRLQLGVLELQASRRMLNALRRNNHGWHGSEVETDRLKLYRVVRSPRGIPRLQKLDPVEGASHDGEKPRRTGDGGERASPSFVVVEGESETIIHLSDDIDLVSADAFKRQILKVVERGHPLVINLLGVVYLDTRGLRMLEVVNDVCRNRRTPLVIVAPALVRRMLNIVGLDASMAMAVSLEEARARLRLMPGL